MNKNDYTPRLEAEEKIKIDIDFEGLSVRKRRRFPFFAFLLLIVLALICFFIFKSVMIEDKAQNEPFIEAFGNEETLWQGAFESEQIFNSCKEASVSIISQGKRCSGFVYSSDGWIATVEGAVNENVKGQIEVVLFDGSRFFVEAFRQNRESGLVLMKINASGLTAVNLSGGEIFYGEELFTFCTLGEATEGGSLFSGKVAHINRFARLYRADGGTRNLKLFQIGTLLTEEGEGAPFFDGQGFLVGIACADFSSEERYMIDYAYSFCDVKLIFESLKNGKSVEESMLLPIIAE